MAAQARCPCDSGRPLAGCCAPLLDGTATAASAEQLMRSRYTAFVLGRTDYLRATWHAVSRPGRVETRPGLRWLGLDVLHTEAGRPGDSHGVVEFVARSKLAGRAHRLHETSRFVFEQGRWWYVDGDLHPR